jgi:hypothetical protein
MGLFSERIIDVWTRTNASPYSNIGRPTLKERPEGKDRSTLDFLFQNKKNEKRYIVEMKCWLEYDNYRFLSLNDPSQLTKIHSASFRRFLCMARQPDSYRVKSGQQFYEVNGSILVWGKVSQDASKKIKTHFGFADVISLESVINDLVHQRNKEYADLITRYSGQCRFLFDALLT